MKITMPKTPAQWILTCLAGVFAVSALNAAVSTVNQVSGTSAGARSLSSADRERLGREIRDNNRQIAALCRQHTDNAKCKEFLASYADD